MSEPMTAGKLNQPVTVLSLKKSGTNAWEWLPERKTWAQILLQEKRNLFSSVGIGARNAEVVMRRQVSTPGTMLCWGEQYLYVTSSVPRGRGFVDVNAAVVTISACQKDANREPMGATFPGVLTEKYVGHKQMTPLAVVTTDYVLVTPKEITLAPGSWVICDGTYYRVLVPHELDRFKNEYEVRRKEDC